MVLGLKIHGPRDRLSCILAGTVMKIYRMRYAASQILKGFFRRISDLDNPNSPPFDSYICLPDAQVPCWSMTPQMPRASGE